MRNPSHRRESRLQGVAAAFTLVELITATSLMTVMMLGVVEIFGIITETASEADALHFAQQQARAIFDHLDRDVRGMAREGYLKINRNLTPATVYNEGTYRSDALSFVSIGSWKSAWDPTKASTAAEVLYTTSVKTPDVFCKIDNRKVDHRKGVLARGTWLMVGEPPGTGLDTDDKSNAAYLGELLAGISLGRSATSTAVWPWSGRTMESEEPWSLTRVMACCVSEFFVEYWDLDKDGREKWVGDADLTSSPGSRESILAIRVTIAIHDPDDRLPPPTDEDGDEQRFRGYVFQQVFWIGDP